MLDAPFINISAYRFVRLENLTELREAFRQHCQAHALKGTCLLSTEGFNLFLAGSKEAIEATKTVIQHLFKSPDFNDFKESTSPYQPFKRLLVKIKKEIISFGQEAVTPEKKPAPYVSPLQLKQWLDEGLEVTLLDTRNNYEVRLGAFENALTLPIHHFREFPETIKTLPTDLKKKKIVTYCTGGIRCEKAAPLLQLHGFENVYQLEGGILRYFEHCGSAHYAGDCFVFDQRVALDSTLAETNTVQCFACRMPVTTQDQQNPQYVIEKSCPACYNAPSTPLQHKEIAHESLER